MPCNLFPLPLGNSTQPRYCFPTLPSQTFPVLFTGGGEQEGHHDGIMHSPVCHLMGTQPGWGALLLVDEQPGDPSGGNQVLLLQDLQAVGWSGMLAIAKSHLYFVRAFSCWWERKHLFSPVPPSVAFLDLFNICLPLQWYWQYKSAPRVGKLCKLHQHYIKVKQQKIKTLKNCWATCAHWSPGLRQWAICQMVFLATHGSIMHSAQFLQACTEKQWILYPNCFLPFFAGNDWAVLQP